MVSRNDIRNSVDAEVSQVEVPRRIWEHGKNVHVIGGLTVDGRGRGSSEPAPFEQSPVAPFLTPFSVQCGEVELCSGVASIQSNGRLSCDRWCCGKRQAARARKLSYSAIHWGFCMVAAIEGQA